jgi:uncharacterized alkaline shock family protein YloU
VGRVKNADKVLIFVYLIALTFLIGAVIVIPFGLFMPYSLAIRTVEGSLYTYRWVYLAAGLVLILLNIKLLIGILIGDRIGRLGIVKYTSEGEVNISFDTIKSLVLKTVSGIKGIKDVNVMVKPGKENINIFIKALILPDTNIPQTVKEVQESVKNYIQIITEVPVGEVKVMVTDLASSSKLRVE